MMNEFILFFLFLILGAIFRTGKAAFLISGFSSLPSSERKKWDESKLSKFAGNMFLLISVIYIIAIIVRYLFPTTGTCVMEYANILAVIVGMVGFIFVNFSKRLKK